MVVMHDDDNDDDDDDDDWLIKILSLVSQLFAEHLLVFML